MKLIVKVFETTKKNKQKQKQTKKLYAFPFQNIYKWSVGIWYVTQYFSASLSPTFGVDNQNPSLTEIIQQLKKIET